MRAEMAVLFDTGKSRFEQQAAALASATQQALRSSMEQQLPAIEKDLLERCHAQAERLMAGQVEQWTLLLSDRAQQAQQDLLPKLAGAAEEAAARCAAQLETRSEELFTQAGARLEQQLNRIGSQVRQAFLRHLVSELSRSQQVWIQQAQRKLEGMATDHLQWTRRHLADVMKNFGEALIRQAYADAGATAEAGLAADSARVGSQAERLSAVSVEPS